MSDTPLWTWSPVKERIAVLNDNPYFLPWDTISTKLLPCIATVVFSLSCLYTVAVYVVRYLAPKDDLRKVRKMAYQMTNLCVNFFLGTVGFYIYNYVLPPHTTVEEQIAGFQDMYFLSCFQIAYQLWSIPVGLIYVRETVPMLVHHLTVLIVASLSCFFTNGFRYWTTFFYGVVEISSVPLAIMNTFKDNRHWIIEYPKSYMAVRIAFAISFLIVRVYFYVPQKLRFLRDEYLLYSTNPSMLYKIYMSFVWISSLTLLSLQSFWASLIVKGLVGPLLLKKKSKKEDTNGVKLD